MTGSREEFTAIRRKRQCTILY